MDLDEEYLSNLSDDDFNRYIEYIEPEDELEDEIELPVVDENKKKKKPKSSGSRTRKKNADDVKLQLAALMSKEPVIWDLQLDLHSNTNALAAAWNRIAAGLPGKTGDNINKYYFKTCCY